MNSTTARRMALIAGAAALVGMGSLSACGTMEKKDDVTPSPSQTDSAPPSPTEKVLTPGPYADGRPDNPYAPTVKAPPPQTALPGNAIPPG